MIRNFYHGIPISLLIGDFMEEIQRVWVAIYMYTAVMNESYNIIHAHYGFLIAPQFLTMIQCYYK